MLNIITKITDKLLQRDEGDSKNLIDYIKDRLGDDFRYDIDTSKLKNDLGWTPSLDFSSLKKPLNVILAIKFDLLNKFYLFLVFMIPS